MSTTAVKERPILFSTSLIKPILEGRKTVTRRVVKPQPLMPRPDGITVKMYQGRMKYLLDNSPWHPGVQLWVRETWSPDHKDFYPFFKTVYRADCSMEIENGKTYSPEAKKWFPFRWRPSIHMPRWASRITLEIVSVRVERLQDIHWNTEELEAEGMELPAHELYPHENRASKLETIFVNKWDQLNKERGYSWESNPWVWRIEFRKL